MRYSTPILDVGNTSCDTLLYQLVINQSKFTYSVRSTTSKSAGDLVVVCGRNEARVWAVECFSLMMLHQQRDKWIRIKNVM